MAWRNMKRNHSCQLPRSICFVDTETEDCNHNEQDQYSTQRLKLGHCEIGRIEKGKWTRAKELTFVNRSLFWNFVLGQSTNRQTTWIVAHNAVFDCTHLGLWQLLENGIFVIDSPRSFRHGINDAGSPDYGRGICVTESPPVIVGLRHVATGKRLIVVDSLNYFRCPLADLGSHFGIEKPELPDRQVISDDLIERCRVDVEILKRGFLSLIEFVSLHDLGVFRYTASSQSLSAFRHRFMKHSIVFHDDAQAKKLERNCYFGGATIIFKPGWHGERMYQVDVNSLYPFVMVNTRFPRKLVRSEVDGGAYITKLPCDPADCAAICLCVNRQQYLPYRTKHCTEYSDGAGLYYLCGEELATAIKLDVVKVILGYTEYICDYIFRDFAEWFLTKRMEYRNGQNKPLEYLCKLLANSLYGKLGQLQPQWENDPAIVAPQAWHKWFENNHDTGEVTPYRSIGWHVQRMTGRAELPNTLVAIPAFVTSAAREYMRLMRQAIGVENIFYQGVDSLVLNQAGYDCLVDMEMMDRSAPGMFKLVCEGESGEFRAKMSYRIGEKTVIAGKPKHFDVDSDFVYSGLKFSGMDRLFSGENDSNEFSNKDTTIVYKTTSRIMTPLERAAYDRRRIKWEEFDEMNERIYRDAAIAAETANWEKVSSLLGFHPDAAIVTKSAATS